MASLRPTSTIAASGAIFSFDLDPGIGKPVELRNCLALAAKGSVTRPSSWSLAKFSGLFEPLTM